MAVPGRDVIRDGAGVIGGGQFLSAKALVMADVEELVRMAPDEAGLVLLGDEGCVRLAELKPL
jgi:hypothetical protein